MPKVTANLTVLKELSTLLRKLSDGKIFGVKFIKKDGSLRSMSCRFDVKKNLTGVGMSYDPSERGYIIVWDMHKKGYRTVNLNTLVELTVDGWVYTRNEYNKWEEMVEEMKG